MRNSVCKTCGSEREVLYELDWAPVYFCKTCETTAHGSNLEFEGPAERAIDEAGE
jgi:hypothetical protein